MAAFLGGAALMGILAILAVLLQVFQIGQTEIHANMDDIVNATLIAIQAQQLESLKGITTIQANPIDDKPTLATSAAKQVDDLEGTVESLEKAKLSVEATATANAESISYPDEIFTVPSHTNSGVVYQALRTGRYTFSYADSAFYAFPGQPDANYPGWSTIVVGFRGSQPQWSDSYDLNYDVALFSIGSEKYATEQAAVNATKGESATVNMTAGDQIVFVVGDGRPHYSDNTGEILLNVSFSP